jgi:hypothetical protein|tara:strand:- start:2230 stop:2385 length:156 start_codon:yes stop_codon:yes gene_type:complete
MSKTTELIVELYWEYDRMSSDGQQALDNLAKHHGVLTEDEVKLLTKHREVS